MTTLSPVKAIPLVALAAGLLSFAASGTHWSHSGERHAGPPHSRVAMNHPPVDVAPTVVAIPDPTLELHTLGVASPMHGGQRTWTLAAKPGQLWINLNCRGKGSVAVEFAPLDRFTLACDSKVLVTRNQINLVKPHVLEITASAPATVEWAVRIEQ